MWLLHKKAKEYGQLPSQLRRISNSLAAYQLDNAVLFLGLTIENAVAEREKIGDEYQAKYTIEQLLDPDFRLPSITTAKASRSSGGLRAMAAANPDMVGRWKQEAKAA